MTKIMIINTDYDSFFRSFYKNKKIKKHTYKKQLKERFKTNVGMNNYYSEGFKSNGVDAKEFFYNNTILQKQWAKENKPILNILYPFRHIIKLNRFLDFFGLPNMQNIWYDQILKAQIKKYRPDIIINQNLSYIKNDLMHKIKKQNKFIKLIIGQHSSPLTRNTEKTSAYNLIISATDAVVKQYEKKGIQAKLIRLGFGEKIIDEIINEEKNTEVIFIGTISKIHHKKRTKMLEKIATKTNKITLYGNIDSSIPKNSILRKINKGTLWGTDMYRAIKTAKICLNSHGELKLPHQHAANMRIYEVAGMGTMLLTDNMPRMNEILKPGKECVTYEDENDCIKKINYYLKNEKERKEIAKNGQQKILKEHTYKKRCEEIINEINILNEKI